MYEVYVHGTSIATQLNGGMGVWSTKDMCQESSPILVIVPSSAPMCGGTGLVPALLLVTTFEWTGPSGMGDVIFNQQFDR